MTADAPTPAAETCEPKTGAYTGQVYCRRHGRGAGWPCATAALTAQRPVPPSADTTPAPDTADRETLRDVLRVHHPVMRSETGPFSGCRCGGVRLGQDVIQHVVDHLATALVPQPTTADDGGLVTVRLPADDVAFIRGFDPDRDRTASRADMVRVVEHLQAALAGPETGGGQ